MQIIEFANSIDLDEVAHNESPHVDLHCLPCNLRILNITFFENLQTEISSSAFCRTCVSGAI